MKKKPIENKCWIRYVGTHKGCGGRVNYHYSPSMGNLICELCGQSSFEGISPEYIPDPEEIERLKSLKNPTT